MLGTLLSWMNDHTSNVYVVATCNDISKLPPELTRAERFDGIVFLDLPGRKQKDRIWKQYLELFQLDIDQKIPKDDQFTGRRDPILLSFGGTTGCSSGPSQSQCRPRRGHGKRIRQLTSKLGQWSMSR